MKLLSTFSEECCEGLFRVEDGDRVFFFGKVLTSLVICSEAVKSD